MIDRVSDVLPLLVRQVFRRAHGADGDQSLTNADDGFLQHCLHNEERIVEEIVGDFDRRLHASTNTSPFPLAFRAFSRRTRTVPVLSYQALRRLERAFFNVVQT